MKSIYPQILLTMTLLFTGTFMANSQCPNDNNAYGYISSIAPGSTASVSCMWGGEYATVNVVSGSAYTFSTCGGSWDTQLTLYSASVLGGSALAYNDDFCSLQSQITWTATFTGQVRVVLDKWPCGSYSSCMTLNVTRAGAPAVNPCLSIISINCNQSYTYSLSGSGGWNGNGPYSTPGSEQVFEFTPTVTGSHSIQMTHSGGGWSDLFIKSGSCGPSGWSYIDDVYSSATNNVTLNAGTTYYFLIDDENTSTSSGSISITCPTPAANPCDNITALVCGETSYATLGSGSGAWNPPGPWGTPGKEKVFSYTPTFSGAYDVAVTTNSSWVDLFYKSGTCGSTGWSYVNDISSSETNSLNLIGGVTYLFLIDDENTSASSVSINISCPCIPPAGGIDNSIVITSDTSYVSSTIGACNDCSYRSSNDRVLELEITCAGNYTISTCGGASWDTYLYLSTAPCGGSLIAYNDDNCGLQSSITAYLNPGIYYVAIEGYSSLSQGDFELNITKECSLSASIGAEVNDCGYNISCNGLSDGEAFVNLTNACGNINYDWSNGVQTSTNSGMGAGYYYVLATDNWGCVASASITLTEPDQLVVEAGNDQTVYYGYTPLSCADLSGTASGGCAEYLFSWSAYGSTIATGSSTTECPNVSTDYTLTAVDQNGCTASDDVHVCVIDVTCFAGASGVQKVQMCHTPPGNPGNPQTICINESAVAAHLAHGCSLGSCDEQENCAPATVRLHDEISHQEAEFAELIVSPNPFKDQIEIELFLEQQGSYRITLLNAFGQVVEELFDGEVTLEKNTYSINTQNLQNGMYFLRATDSNGSAVVSKIIKM
jgi:hypothetical protein